MWKDGAGVHRHRGEPWESTKKDARVPRAESGRKTKIRWETLGGRGRTWHSVLLKDLKEGFTRHLAKHTLTVSKPNKTKRSGPVLETISDVNRGVLEYLNLSAWGKLSHSGTPVQLVPEDVLIPIKQEDCVKSSSTMPSCGVDSKETLQTLSSSGEIFTSGPLKRLHLLHSTMFPD